MADGNGVVYLSRIPELHVADGDADVRGWEVVGADGQVMGAVDDLLLDPELMRVRYLAVMVDDALLPGDRHILVPIGQVRLDEEEDRVYVDNLEGDQIRHLPDEAAAEETQGGVVDPLAEARWGQVRGDESGIRGEWAGEAPTTDTQYPDRSQDDAGPGGTDSPPNVLTGDAGDPGGER